MNPLDECMDMEIHNGQYGLHPLRLQIVSIFTSVVEPLLRRSTPFGLHGYIFTDRHYAHRLVEGGEEHRYL